MNHRQEDAALALLILSFTLAAILAFLYARSGRDAAPPEERCPIVEAAYSPPVSVREAGAGGRPSAGGWYTLRDCGTGQLVRAWIK